MKKTLLMLALSVITGTLSFGQYPNVTLKNFSTSTAMVNVKYVSPTVCKDDTFFVAAGATGTARTSRGVCLVASVNIAGAVSYTSTGTAYSTFALIKHPNGAIHVHRTDAAFNPQDLVASCGVAGSTTPAIIDTWTDIACNSAMTRWKAAGFVVGTKIYVGTGNVGDNTKGKNDFWEYDPATNIWTAKAAFPGGVRSGAISFSVNGKGYMGFGANASNQLMNDFYEYNPTTNTWTQKATPIGYSRQDATGFSIGSKGYMACGDDIQANTDFYEYDPGANTWTKKAAFPGLARKNAVGFSIGGNGYLGTGSSVKTGVETFYNDFYEYNPTTNVWTKKADFPGGTRSYATGFCIGSKGYLGSGHAGADTKSDFYEFNPTTNVWTKRKDMNISRAAAIGASVGSKAYIFSGFNFNTAKNATYNNNISVYVQ